MESPRKGTPRGRRSRLVLWAGLAVGGLFPAVGCQVEYAGMTLPSSKYMHDDVQYFAPGPDFPWANTQAASQRARMQAMGLEVPSAMSAGPNMSPTRPAGALPPSQNIPNMPTNVNVMPSPAGEGAEGIRPAPVAPDASPTPPAPGEAVPPPGGGPAPAVPPGFNQVNP